MSRLLIQSYVAELSKLRQVSGTHRERVVREAFKDLLKGWARSHDLTFVPEYEIQSPAKERRYVDGALLYGLRLPFGYWEPAQDQRRYRQSELLIDRPALAATFFPPGKTNSAICFSDAGSRTDYVVLAINGVADLHFGASIDAYQQVALHRFDESGNEVDNITDWALKQFKDHYKSSASPSPQPSPASGRGGKSKAPVITKEAIFHYVYAVLHDPVYRETYAQNLKREFPRKRARTAPRRRPCSRRTRTSAASHWIRKPC